ncbi:MAG: HNH endonuclease [Nanoarchaeota archaeon]|nr:HNH endonuclease [Nanoarchaeota archaeon]
MNELIQYSPELVNQFWPNIKVNKNGCWDWIGSKHPRGYGRLFTKGKAILAHRFSFFLDRGYWPTDCVCHHCDRPSCVNPAHLFAGSQADNVRDAIHKNRFPQPRGILLDSMLDAVKQTYRHHSCAGVAQIFGVKRDAVVKFLCRHKVKLRPRYIRP